MVIQEALVLLWFDQSRSLPSFSALSAPYTHHTALSINNILSSAALRYSSPLSFSFSSLYVFNPWYRSSSTLSFVHVLPDFFFKFLNLFPYVFMSCLYATKWLCTFMREFSVIFSIKLSVLSSLGNKFHPLFLVLQQVSTLSCVYSVESSSI